MKTALGILALAALVSGASAQVIGTRAELDALLTTSTVEDFQNYPVADGNTEEVNSSFDSNSNVNGHLHVVKPGATYSVVSTTDSESFAWNGDGYNGLVSKTLSLGAGRIQVAYGTGIQAVGFDAKAFQEFVYAGRMDVFSGIELVGQVSFSLSSGGSESKFVGFQHSAGITSVRFEREFGTDSAAPVVIDNHTYGGTAPVPEPATMALAVLALAAAARRRARNGA